MSAGEKRVQDQPVVLGEYLVRHARRHPHAVAWRKKRRGSWQGTTWREAAETVRELAHALRDLGVAAGQPIGVIADWDPEVLMIDLAAQSIGAWPLAVSPLVPTDDVIAILASSEARIAICGDADLVQELARRKLEAGLEHVIAIESALALPGELPVDTVEALRERNRDRDQELPSLSETLLERHGDEIAFAGFTAGTAGEPKEVVIRQSDGILAAGAMVKSAAMGRNDRVLCHFPLTHPLGRILGAYTALVAGAALSFPQGRDTLTSDMAEFEPTVVLAPPRFLEALHAHHVRRLGASSRMRQRIAGVAMGWLDEAWEQPHRGRPRALELARRSLGRLVLGRWVRVRLGLRAVRWLGCLGPVRDDLLGFYGSLDVPVSELYAKAELGGLLACARDVGSLVPAGDAPDCVEIRVEANGELSVRTPWRSGDPRPTTGWHRTGDRGALDPDGRVHVAGRFEEVTHLANGTLISLPHIERAVARSPYIARAVASVAAGERVSVLVELDFETIALWRRRLGIVQTAPQRLVEEPALVELVVDEVSRAIESLPGTLHLQNVRLLPRELDVALHELTPIGTVRRRRVQEQFSGVPPALSTVGP